MGTSKVISYFLKHHPNKIGKSDSKNTDLVRGETSSVSAKNTTIEGKVKATVISSGYFYSRKYPKIKLENGNKPY